MEETETKERIMGEMSTTFHNIPSSMPRTIADFLKELLCIPDLGDRASKIDDFLSRLREEMRKIEAFKRELPLCVILLNDVIEALNEEADRLNASPVGVSDLVLAEFIPLRCREGEEGQELKTWKETDPKDMKNWMSSVQLWNADHNPVHSSARIPLLEPQCKKLEGRAFMAFKGSGYGTVASGKGSDLQLREEQSSSGSGLASVPSVRMVSCRRSISSSVNAAPPNSWSTGQHQLPSKQRRCWVPDLHRQFVDALEKLGGPQVATPKQIRELMQVDGLTNDEVKSHLQKYRLHTRGLLNKKGIYPSNQSAAPGDLLMNHEDKSCESSRVSSSQSRSPQDPFQLANNKSRTSLTGGDSIEEDYENESQSWKIMRLQIPEKDDV